MGDEEQQEKPNNNAGIDLLLGFGVEAITAKKLSKQRNLETIQAWITYAVSNNLGAGFVVSRLKTGESPPVKAKELSHSEKLRESAIRLGLSM